MDRLKCFRLNPAAVRLCSKLQDRIPFIWYHRLCHAEKLPFHDICEGGHQWNGERLDMYLKYIGK